MLVEFLGDPYHPLGGLLACFGGFSLAWIVGWKVATLRLGCEIPTFVILYISLITLIQISFHKFYYVDNV